MIRAVRTAVLAAVVCAVVFVVYVGVTFVEVWRAARHDGARPADAILVLGAAQYDGVPSPVLRARLDHALELYEAGIAPVIVVTGGRREGDRFTEATAGATYLHQRGVADDAILRETTGRSTWESLRAAARFLTERGIADVVLVSDPYHAARIDAIAEEVGIDAVVSPTRTSPIDGTEEWKRFGGEAVRVAIGRIFGFGRLERHAMGSAGTRVAML